MNFGIQERDREIVKTRVNVKSECGSFIWNRGLPETAGKKHLYTLKLKNCSSFFELRFHHVTPHTRMTFELGIYFGLLSGSGCVGEIYCVQGACNACMCVQNRV